MMRVAFLAHTAIALQVVRDPPPQMDPNIMARFGESEEAAQQRRNREMEQYRQRQNAPQQVLFSSAKNQKFKKAIFIDASFFSARQNVCIIASFDRLVLISCSSKVLVLYAFKIDLLKE